MTAQENGNRPQASAAGETMSDALHDKLERRLSEACSDFWDSFVDPREAYWDDDGGWLPLAAPGGRGPGLQSLFVNEQQLREIRIECRLLAATNEFAINGHENRISYLVGPGHVYRATIRKGHADDPQLVAAAQEVIDRFLLVSKWHRRQQEIVRRLDRDGEVFLRFFVDETGSTTVRFVEPDQVATPAESVGDPAASFGILTDSQDVEAVLGYFVDGRPVDAADIQHRKANVDANVKRGLPLFFPVRKNLRRADKLLRNMSVVAEIQSAIALIRKHHGSTKGSVQQFAASQADATVTQGAAGRTTSFRRFGPGTILDAPSGIDYDFPASGLDAASYVTVLQAELRAIASRLVMPEFMLTSDASNSNYASTMVAEGPAMRMFARLQADLVTDDVLVMWRVLADAVAAGRLPAGSLTEVDIQISPPSLAVRDQKQEVDMYQIEYQNGILSPQTWSQRRGLDYGQEQMNLAQHSQRPQEAPGGIVLDPVVPTVE
jgi:capsid protein